jgi:hypothetical protein
MANPNPDRIPPVSTSRVPPPSAARGAASPCAPITLGSTRYELVYGSTVGEFRAVEEKSGKVLWSLKLWDYALIDGLETDVQEVYAARLEKGPGGTILVADERRVVYMVDPATKSARIKTWPVSLRLISRSPLAVEVILSNSMKRTVAFNKPGVAFGGRLHNNLFKVLADDKPVSYHGEMKKRVPPEDFLVLKSHEDYNVVVDLSNAYPIPKGTKTVEVEFSHHNHFSKDDFDLESAPLTIHMDGPEAVLPIISREAERKAERSKPKPPSAK